MSALTIVQLYPDEMGVAGDAGNVLALSTRARRSGHATEVVRHEVGQELPANADIVVIGGGPMSAMRRIHADLMANAQTLKLWADSGVSFFAYGAGAELLSHGVTAGEAELSGVGVFPFRAERTGERVVGYLIVDSVDGPVVGFADHASRWLRNDSAESFGVVSAGVVPAGQAEGVIIGSAIATLIGGPVLPLNPDVTDAILSRALARRGETYSAGAGQEGLEEHRALDHYASEARAVIRRNAEHHFKRI
ncbi:hypothetical protein OH146_01830 [Salinibacterium sp. SYSU T00001]|uniref:type 1 glutamine amidotransferase n=1 Tax=Homoserinimonas sedimenticola TaxID=2986805 RepID=UPI0022359ACF|nr:hypothetical protein [Salinibacterium sedimenticola]MCW4384509.1 hypothetical protein [Salinibacterium sedimenticola]